MASASAALPIDEILEALQAALAAKSRVVLVAPPGAGKTTRAPLALLDQPFLHGRKLLLLEPRRLAARAAAQRMAATLGEKVGETIGLRVRMEQIVSAKTRIEVLTEGVFTRMILDDPSLGGIGAVLFDEFHERSLDADLGLALALDAQSGLREDLRLLVMSATLDGARVASLLGDAPIVESAGRAYPVETRYVGRDPGLRIEEDAARIATRALAAERGSILVFLPGQGEIMRCAALLEERVRDPQVDIAPLFGAMDRAAQDIAIAPSPPGRRKIVLATSIAETSLTIEGVRIVIDSGLSRVPHYEPDIGVTRLETGRVSRASADQRRGRAGRTGPGICYRLWEEAANGALVAFARPEILSADLSGLVLDLAVWGVADPSRLAFLDPPPAPALAEARALLVAIGALDHAGRITDEGRAIAGLALPPRLARMVVDAARQGQAALAARIAVLISERGLGGDSVDLAERLERWAKERSPRAEDARRLAGRIARSARDRDAMSAETQSLSLGPLLALAFPERIAKARGRRGEFLMANGRAASLSPETPLAGAQYLAIGEATGRAAATRILLAAALDQEEIEKLAADRIETKEETVFDRASASLRARRTRRLGAIVLSEQTLSVAPSAENAELLAEGLLSLGLDRLPWSKDAKQWRDRVAFVARAEPGEWPDLSDAALSRPDWLAPFLIGATALADVTPALLAEALEAQLPYALRRRLDLEAPTHFTAPTGSRIPIDYAAEGGPAIALRVQELFGLNAHPTLAEGKAPLTLHLLSPAHRPIQITRDLPGFWRGSWNAVKAEMRGRYPRHVWPDNPAAAAPTTRAKPRS
ncbi:MAG TPA: ATP-dependent helicase HrpB [Roseiarcus sp.]|nr:ATP-dependent helicase HrpB [Roseiarcus sp.]